MNGVTWIGEGVFAWGVSDLTWQVAGTGDFNNDGHVDILWRYNGAGGYNDVWYMNGVTWIGEGVLPSESNLNWRIVSR
jgi:hypothetical protein